MKMKGTTRTLLPMKSRWLLAIAAIISVVTPSRATTLARLNLDQLTSAADGVARVQCTASHAQWESGALWTIINFNNAETLKGTLPQKIVVRVPGGRLGSLTSSVDGTPKFSAGDEVIVFLQASQNADGSFGIIGWVQGTFRIARGERGGAETVTQDSSTFAVFDSATHAFRTDGVRRMPMEEFRKHFSTSLARMKEHSR